MNAVNKQDFKEIQLARNFLSTFYNLKAEVPKPGTYPNCKTREWSKLEKNTSLV
jgi:hypothetical protein